MFTALVTGCDHGLGPALAENLAGRGWRVFACRLSPAEHQIDELSARFPDLISVHELDISSDESVQHLKESLAGQLSSLDLLINCAGILGDMEDGPDGRLNYALMEQVISVNAIGTLRLTAALMDLIRSGTMKTVLNISSEAGSIQDCWRTGWFGYCMSKAANNMQGALIHNTLRPLGGRVIQMHPGHVATFMRGYLDTTASLTPEKSASNILHTVLDTDLPVRDRPLFIDHSGKELPY